MFLCKKLVPAGKFRRAEDVWKRAVKAASQRKLACKESERVEQHVVGASLYSLPVCTEHMGH